MAPPKIRIYELAKMLGLESSKDLIELLEKKYGVTVKSHSSTIDQELADKITAEYSQKKAPAEKPTAVAKPRDADAREKKSTATPVSTAAAPAKTAAKPVRPEPKPQPSISSAQPAAKGSPSIPAVKSTSTPQAKPQPVRSGGGNKAVAQTEAVALEREVAVKTPPEVIEDDAVLDILKPTTEEEPYSTIAQTVERQHRVDTTKTAFKKTPEAERAEKPVTIAPKKDGKQVYPTETIERKASPEPVAAQPPVVKLHGPLSIAELAQVLKKRETELIRHLFMKGVMVTVNQTMPLEDAMKLAEELGYQVEGPSKAAEVDQYKAPELKVRHAMGKHLRPRAPVVSIMGHVDHGKTSLLDAIRESRHKIVDTEAGGITQSIGAYTVEKDDHKIVFIDTPGHEAFTTMRMRGAQATDIAILVVAADDGVMPQTIEAINHAKAANIPIIVAINKIDKPGADPDKVMVQLADYGLTPEKWGGDTITVEVSALQKLGLDDLLEMINLVAELQELKADPTVPAEGVVIEARLDKGKGPVATVLVQNGQLHVGENVLINKVGGRVRALINDYGERIKSAGPSTPVEILGLSDVPQAGDAFIVIRNDKEFKRLLQQQQGQDREQRLTKMAAPSLTAERDTERQDFYFIIKADTQGSVEAITAAILQMATEEISIHVLHAGTGDVSDADVLLASASKAVIIAFNIKEEPNASRTAQDQGIQIRHYDVIYHVTEDIEKLMLGMLTPETEEEEMGVAEVRQLFSFGKTTIAGCRVTEGKMVRNGLTRVFRNGKQLFEGTLSNLKRFKEDAREVAAGYECGISYDKFNDLQPGDIIKLYVVKEKERTSL